jgi:hypothetical protein
MQIGLVRPLSDKFKIFSGLRTISGKDIPLGEFKLDSELFISHSLLFSLLQHCPGVCFMKLDPGLSVSLNRSLFFTSCGLSDF